MSKQVAIEYDQSAIDALAACMTYLQEAEDYIDGKRAALPDPQRLLQARFPTSTILSASAIDRAKGVSSPTISAKIVDSVAKRHRYFDPWYFVVMLLLELPGGRFILAKSKFQEYAYVAYAGRTIQPNFYLRRIVVNTPIWADTLEGKHSDGAHYDYRRTTLHWISKDAVRTLGKPTRRKSSNREAAVKFAVDLFEEQVIAHHGRNKSGPVEKLPGLDLTAMDYEKLLWVALYIADGVHEKHLRLRAGNV
ncbi:hypothetical protein ACM41_25755 [Bradyrhizobium sp. CCBAU 21362]|uniref:hypothetical protein n=1 Tax=Bradyrhizobium sp. CCBAU 21362 TaxID=1325082 RepID=UPI002304EC3A|nr:hypothetical protein [Bradyrhizobium sp. CCBAU 21362]MDA9539508.1 hypothetical protein [Bradyrhizobium sp. CCBAU 21362]